jgi:hypothetical protein
MDDLCRARCDLSSLHGFQFGCRESVSRKSQDSRITFAAAQPSRTSATRISRLYVFP